MNWAPLHLVAKSGDSVDEAIATAVQVAYRWVTRSYPRIDPALVADWAEEIASSMQDQSKTIQSPQRYAFAALRGKIHDWLKRGIAREESSGIGSDLESKFSLDASFQVDVDRKLLFEQLKATLNERDRYILILLLQDQTSPATVAESLDIGYAAAAKAIQRVKERIAATLAGTRTQPGCNSGRLCETKG